MENKRKPRGYWDNYETCYEAARKCDSKTEFTKRFPTAYSQAIKVREDGKRWIDDYHWFKRPVQHNIKWKGNYDACYQEARKYETRTEFAKCSAGAYQVALDEGWLDDYYWLKRDLDIYKNKKDNIYGYFFNELNSVYIGRTINPKQRDNSHRHKSTVYKFAVSNNIPVPQMIILESNLTPDEGLEREDYYVKKYKEEGWNLLNKAKTGKNSGSLGSASKRWTYNRTYNEARKYRNRTQFRKGCSGGYDAAYREGWLDDYYWFEEVKNTPKPVIQLTLGGNIISFFESASKAAKTTNCKQGNISACCRGKQQTSGGFGWIQDTVDSLLIEKMNRTIRNRENIAA